MTPPTTAPFVQLPQGYKPNWTRFNDAYPNELDQIVMVNSTTKEKIVLTWFKSLNPVHNKYFDFWLLLPPLPAIPQQIVKELKQQP